MNIFPIRRRDAALSELRLSDAVFIPLDNTETEPAAVYEPEQPIAVSPANELVTEMVEHDIVEAVRSDNASPPPPSEPVEIPAPLSQRHLETIERMVAHLKSDEKRLEQQIFEARRQLADTQLARHGYEMNSANLRRGIGVLIRLAKTRPAASRGSRAARKSVADPANETGESLDATSGKSRGRGKMH
jgi:hypothetical protein